MQRTLPAAAVLATLLVAQGCASTGSTSDAEKLATYRAAAGEPVNSFSYLGRINGWTPLDDSHIVVWTRPREAFLLDLFGPCQDIDFTPIISFTSQGSRVYAGFDEVIVHNRSAVRMPCRIREIRPLDTARIRAAEKAVRDGDQADDQAEAQPPASGT